MEQTEVDFDVLLCVCRMYTAHEGERLTPPSADSPRTHQLVSSARYPMQPFLHDQFVNALPSSRFYGTDRSLPPEDCATSHRWFVTSMQQPYESEYLPYALSSRALTCYSDSAFASMATGWGSKVSYQNKIPASLPWSPRPSSSLSEDKVREDEWAESVGYTAVCKRRRVSRDESNTENSPSIKCEDSRLENYGKDASSGAKSVSCCAFYTPT